jgi:hypothetical protein
VPTEILEDGRDLSLKLEIKKLIPRSARDFKRTKNPPAAKQEGVISIERKAILLFLV